MIGIYLLAVISGSDAALRHAQEHPRGVLLGLFWPAALVFCVTWLATAALSRYSSLSVLVASFVTPIFLWWFGH
jgi:hypothetical protein